MSRNLYIAMDEQARRVTAGGMLRGEIIVEVDDETRCDRLVVQLVCQTQGRGNRDLWEGDLAVPFVGKWSPGRYRYPFALEVPTEPITYRGHYLNIEYLLEASADVPWAFDPKDEVEVIVEAPQGARSVEVFAASEGLLERVAPWQLVLGVCVMGIPVLWAAGLLRNMIRESRYDIGSLMIFAFAAVMGVLCLIGLFNTVRNYLATRKLGDVHVEGSPFHRDGHVGVEIDVTCAPSSQVEINAITATLIGKEIVVSGSGTNRSTYRHTVHEGSVRLCSQRTVEAAEQLAWMERILLPAQAPPTIDIPDNELMWSVRVHIDIARWPDYIEEIPIVVKPTPPQSVGAQPFPIGVVSAGEEDSAPDDPSGPAW